jgi:hypothetical protein
MAESMTLPRMIVERTEEEKKEATAKWEMWRKEKAKQLRREKKQRAAMDKKIQEELAEAHRITAERVKKLKAKAKSRKVQKLRPIIKKTKGSTIVSRAKASPLGDPVLTAAQAKRLGSTTKKWEPTKVFSS